MCAGVLLCIYRLFDARVCVCVFVDHVKRLTEFSDGHDAYMWRICISHFDGGSDGGGSGGDIGELVYGGGSDNCTTIYYCHPPPPLLQNATHLKCTHKLRNIVQCHKMRLRWPISSSISNFMSPTSTSIYICAVYKTGL